MEPFIAKPGERITGLGLDFASRLAESETVQSVAVAVPAGITSNGTGQNGTKAFATLTIGGATADGDYTVTFTATGTAGSIRIGNRLVTVRAGSN